MFLTNPNLCFFRMTLISLSIQKIQISKLLVLQNKAVRIFTGSKGPFTHSLQPVGDLLATKIGRLQSGCKAVGDWSATGSRWLQGRNGRKEVLVAASETSLRPNRSQKGFWWSPTGCRQVADWLQWLQTIPTQYLVADQSPIGCRPISKKSQTFCNQKQTLKIQPPTSCRPIANRLPIAPQLIADWSRMCRQPLSDYTTL